MMTAKLFENGRSQAVEKNRIAISLFLSPITILNFDSYAAEEYGKIQTDLERKGTPIGPLDMPKRKKQFPKGKDNFQPDYTYQNAFLKVLYQLSLMN